MAKKKKKKEEEKSFLSSIGDKVVEFLDPLPELKQGGQALGLVESDDEKAARLDVEAETDRQLAEAEEIRMEPWKDPNIAAASIAMANQQANMYRQMKSRGNTAAEQSSITGQTLSKFNIGGNQQMAVLQMKLREAKAKEVRALKSDNYELAKAARIEKQQITKLLMDIAQMGLSFVAGGGVGGAGSALTKYLESQSFNASAYNQQGGLGASDLNLELNPYGNQPNGFRDDNNEISGGLSSRYR
jgi:hypothetical protein